MKDNIYTTKQHEGMERAAALFVVITPTGNMSYLAHSWGKINGQSFFDTMDDHHIELHGNFSYILHVPSQGKTFDLNGEARDLQAERQLVVVQ